MSIMLLIKKKEGKILKFRLAGINTFILNIFLFRNVRLTQIRVIEEFFLGENSFLVSAVNNINDI